VVLIFHEATMESPEAAGPRGPLWLALRVLDEPVAVFRQLAEHPRALAPIILLALAAAVLALGTPAETLRREARNQADAMEDVLGDRFTEEDRLRIIDGAASTRSRAITFAAAIVGGLISITVAALVLKLIFSATSGATITFRDEFAIAAHAYVPQMIGIVLGVALVTFAGLERPDFSLGSLFGEPGTFLHSFASQLTFFGAWGVFLLAVGNQIKTKAPSVTGALAIVGGLWILLKLVSAGVASMFLT
jgi:hypothetical protein